MSLAIIRICKTISLIGLIPHECSDGVSANILLTCLPSIVYLSGIIFQIVGAENPVLMSAAEQIFSAGGKRVRPALVFLVSRATAELSSLK